MTTALRNPQGRTFAKALVFLAGLLAATGANATILTFGDLGLLDFQPIPQAYGDNVISTNDGVGSYLEGNGFTANVVTSYRTCDGPGDSCVSLNDILYWSSDFGDLIDVGMPNNDDEFGEVTFTADPGFAVVLQSFDLGGWPSLDKPGQQLRIYDGAYNLLQDLTPQFVEGNAGHTTINLGLSSNVVRIQWGNDFDVGIDNINIDQTTVVAEPYTLALFGLGLAGLGFSRRRLH